MSDMQEQLARWSVLVWSDMWAGERLICPAALVCLGFELMER